MNAAAPMLPWAPSPLDALGFPPSGTLGLPLAVILVVALCIVAIAASVLATAPGPIGTRERSAPGFFLVAGIVLRFIGIAVLVVSVVILQFPIRCPEAQFLVSAVGSVDSDAAVDAWKRASETIIGDRKVIDSGALSLQVCDALAASPRIHSWDRDDPETQRKIRDIAVEVIRRELDGTASVSPDDVTRWQEQRLPQWVTQSVEIAVLKAVSLRHNVGYTLIVQEPRRTEMGDAWHNGIIAYLEQNPTRIAKSQVRLIDKGPPPTIRLSGLAIEKIMGRTRVRLSLQVDLRRIDDLNREEIDALLTFRIGQPSATGGIEYRPTDFPANGALRFVTIELPAFETLMPLTVTQVKTGISRQHPAEASTGPDGSPRAVASVFLDVPAGMELRWRTTLEVLATHESFDAWRRGIAREGLEPMPSSALGSMPRAGTIVIRHRRDAVSVGRHGDTSLLADAADRDEPKYPMRITETDRPSGVLGWSGIQLGGTAVGVDARLAGGTMITTTRHGSRFKQIARGLRGGVARPLEVVLDRPAGPDGVRYLATLITLNPADNGLLLEEDGSPAKSFDREVFLSFHTSLIQGVTRARIDRDAMQSDSVAGSISRPAMVILDSKAIQELRSTAVRANAQRAGLGLTIFASGALLLSFASFSRGRE